MKSLRLAGRLLDLGHDAGVLLEELGIDRVPSAEFGDGEQLARHWERLRRIVGTLDGADRGPLDYGPEALLDELLLAGRAQHEVEVRLGLRIRVLQNCSGVLDLQRRVRNDVVEVLTRLPSQDGLVLVRDQHVARTFEESIRGIAAAAG